MIELFAPPTGRPRPSRSAARHQFRVRHGNDPRHDERSPATPGRARGEGVVFTACTLIAGELLTFSAFTIGPAILARAHASVGIDHPGTLRAVVGGGMYLTALGILGYGLGALFRHTAGALSALSGVMLASTALVDLLPTS